MKQPPDMPEPMPALCPYCRQILDKTPKRKTKCPHCGKYIHVRAQQQYVGSALLTQADAHAVDWARQLDIDPADFRHKRRQLAKTLGIEAPLSDVMWSILQERGDTFSMALFSYQVGKDYSSLLEESARRELMRYKDWGSPARVEILAAANSCECCRAQNGSLLTVDEALKTMPLPNKSCTYELAPGRPGWCRCTYLPVLDRYAASLSSA